LKRTAACGCFLVALACLPFARAKAAPPLGAAPSASSSNTSAEDKANAAAITAATQRAIAQVALNNKEPAPQNAAPALANAPVAPQNAALLSFKREQIALAQKTRSQFADLAWPSLDEWIERAKTRAEQIQLAQGDAAATLPGTAPFRLEERAYFADDDGSAQPFWVALPRDYPAQGKYPLVVWLHGYSSATSKIAPSLLDGDTLVDATRLGFVVAIPYGRRNSDFVQWGEDDVLRVKVECLRLYSIDAARTFLSGSSMGGFGAYAVALHTPGQWTAVAPVAGRTDLYRWFGLSRSNLPAWKGVLYDADNPRSLIENGRGTPFFSQHGALDRTVPVEHSRAWFDDAARLRLPFFYLETPNVGHENAFQWPAISRAFGWLTSQPPRAVPRQVSFQSGDLREAKGDWAQIEAFSDYSKLARIEAVIEGSTVDTTTQNVARFSLDLKPLELGTISLRVNGNAAGQLDSALPVVWNAPDAKIGKSPARCGPFKSLMRDPFTLVYGDERDHKDALRFAREWSDCADGSAPVEAASDVSQSDKDNRSLILFGTRDSNPLIHEIGDALPIELLATGFRMGTKRFEGRNLGLRMVRPSPWSQNRLIGICSGAWWGAGLPINHKWDLLPDYLVYDGAPTPFIPDAKLPSASEHYETQHAVRAGFFDGNWDLVDAG